MSNKTIYYKTIEEKKEIISISNYEKEYDHLLDKIIYITEDRIYTINDKNSDDIHFTKVFSLPLILEEDEYFIIFEWDPNNLFVEGNIMVKEYLEEYFPEIFKIENRNDIINDIIFGE